MSEPKPKSNATAVASQGAPFEVFAAQRAVFMSDLTSREKIVALAVIHHMNPAGECWPSIVRLAKVASVAKSTVSSALRTMVDGGWFARERRRSANGDLDSTLYRWVGCPVAGLPADKVTRAAGDGIPEAGRRVARSPGEGCPTSGHKQTKEQPTLNNPKNNGETPPVSFGLKEVWGLIVREYSDIRKAAYGSAGLPDKLSKVDQDDVAQFFVTAAEDARASWPGKEKEASFPVWAQHVIRGVIHKWIYDNDGANDYLRNRSHPLSALRADLATAHAAWLVEWEEKVAAAAAKS